MPEKLSGVDIAAVREHSITSRRTRVHVIVCHDLDAHSHSFTRCSALLTECPRRFWKR